MTNLALSLFFFCLMFGVAGCDEKPGIEKQSDQQMNQRLEQYEQRERLRILESSQPQPISVDEFQKLWNSIDMDMNRGLPLGKVEIQKDEQGVSFFEKQFTPYLKMKVTLDSSGAVDTVTIGGSPKTKLERFMMLSSWSQMISTTSKETEPAVVTNLFHDLGVDANADLSQINNKTVEFHGGRYHTTFENQIYECSFEGAIIK
jgi:hypothetical protein